MATQEQGRNLILLFTLLLIFVVGTFIEIAGSQGLFPGPWARIPWVRLIVVIIGALFIFIGTAIWVVSTHNLFKKIWVRRFVIVSVIILFIVAFLISALSSLNVFKGTWFEAPSQELYTVFNSFASLCTLLGFIGLSIQLLRKTETSMAPSSNTVSSLPQTPAITSQPTIPASQDSVPVPSTPSAQLATPTYKTGYGSILGLPPLTDPRTIQQREKAVKEIYEKLTQPNITALVLTGIGGVGKSTLAALVYRYTEEQRHLGSELFRDAAIWLTINDSVTMLDLAGTLFEALSKPMPDLGNLTPQSQAVALFKALNTVKKSRLIILDQFENLLDWKTGYALTDRPGIGEWLDILNSQQCACRILLTSRPWPQGTREYPPTYMREYPVEGLELVEGVELLRKQGVDVTQASDEELRTAVIRCGGHAFSLTLLASLLRRNRGLHLSTLFNDTLYAQLWIGDIASKLLDYIFTQQLGEIQRKLLLAFSVYREAVALEAAVALLDFDDELSKAQVLQALHALLTQHLLQSTHGRYQLHTIVASYAQDHFDESSEQANQQTRRRAHAKAADYYLQLASRTCPPREQRRKMSDIQTLIEAFWHLCQAGQWQEALYLLEREGVLDDLKRWGNRALLLELCQQLLTLSDRQVELPKLLLITSNMAWAYNTLGKKEEALRYYEEALSISMQLKDLGAQGSILNELGWVYSDLGQKQEALRYLEQSLQLQREVGNRGEEAWTLNNLGWFYGNLVQREKALDYLESALTIHREVGDYWGEGRAINNIGSVYADLGQEEQALRNLEQALKICKEVGDRGGEGWTLNNLGKVYSTLGQKEQAREYLERALRIRREVERRGEGRTFNNLGTVYHSLGQKEKAWECYLEAMSIAKEVGDRGGEGKILYNIAKLYLEQDLYNAALAFLLLAKNIFEEVQSPDYNEAQKSIDAVHKKVGEEQFVALLTQVEPHASQIVEQALQNGL